MKKIIISLIFGIICGCPIYMVAQQVHPITSPLNLYEDGKQYFLQKNYGAAQQALRQFIQNKISPDKKQEAEYMLACTAYELKAKKRIDILRAYLDSYPDSPYSNRINALIASAYFQNGNYDEAIAIFNSCELYLLPDDERDEMTYQLATAYLKVGQLQPAAVWFQTLKESSDKYFKDASYNLAYIDYVEKRYDKALPVFLKLQDDKTYKELVPFYIADIYLIRKNYDKSQIVAQNFLSQYPDSKHAPEMERILGESEYFMGQYQKAVQSLQKYVSAVNHPRRNILYELGLSYFHIGVYTQAAELLGRVTTVNDALTQNAYLHMGLAYLSLQDKNKARMAFEQAANSNADMSIKEQALYNYALCIHETAYSAFSESVTVFERFLNEFPNSPWAEKVSDYLVEVYMSTKSYEAALRSIDKIKRPSNRILAAKQDILFQLGTQAFANADFTKSIDYFNKALVLSQYNQQIKADSYYWRGEAYYKLNRFTDAERDFKLYLEFTAIKNNDMYMLTQYNLGYTAFKQKDYSSARRWFERYINLGNQNNNTLLADAYNRLGDCNFYVRNFSEAAQDYNNAFRLDPSLGDYSLYQEGFVLGLQKDYVGKIHTLNKLIGQYPTSQYADDALYEKGRAYVQMKDNNRAIESFKELLNKFPESALARKGANEIGLLYYQNDDYNQAIQAYEHVAKTYPGSEEARLAQRDLKSIYIDLNRIDDYANFISSIPGGENFDINERDSLTYIAAEKIYMRGDMPEAKNSFIRYLQTFPDGAFNLDAHYYAGLIDYNRNNYAEAITHFEKVIEFPNNKYSEDAMTMSGEIYFNARNFEEAFNVYKRLKEKATSAEKRQIAQLGVLRTAYILGNQPEVIAAATDLLTDNKLAPELKNEARYYRAKSYLAQNATPAAMKDFQELAKDTRNLYGAEAKYVVAQIYFESGDTSKAEKEILDYINQSTPHAYWLARSFVLLSDVYMKMGRNLDAKQYLLSLQQNYHENDDIQTMIESRLKKLNK